METRFVCGTKQESVSPQFIDDVLYTTSMHTSALRRDLGILQGLTRNDLVLVSNNKSGNLESTSRLFLYGFKHVETIMNVETMPS